MQHPALFSSRQQGSVLLQFALLLGVIVAILGVVDLGYMFYAKRELQRNADLSALHAVQSIDFNAPNGSMRASHCAQAGLQSVNANWPASSPITPLLKSATCGEWDAGLYSAPEHFQPNAANVNAARVVLEGRSPAFFPGTWSRVITAQAVAKRGAPQAAFSVGSKLAVVGCRQEFAPLVQVLKIAGVGNPCVTVNGYDGVVDAKITPSGLLKALNLPLNADLTVLDINNLLAAQKVSLGALLDAAVTAAGHSELLGVNASVLRALGAKLGVDAFALEVPLGSGANGAGLFAGIHAPDGVSASALNLELGVLDIISTAIGVGTGGRGVEIPGLSINIPGILPNLLKVKVGVTEPPSIAMGGVDTTAYNSQIRLALQVDTTGGLLGGLLQLLGTQIKLPIYVDLTRAKATLQPPVCTLPSKDSTAQIKVENTMAQVCIGKTSGDPFSIRTPICESIEKETLVSALGLIKIHNKIRVDVLEGQEEFLSPPLTAGQTWSTPGNSLKIGTALQSAVGELLKLLSELLGAPSNNSWTPAENETSAQKMANYYLGIGSEIHPGGAIRKNHTLGLLGPSGAYDIAQLRDRLKADIQRDSKSCLLLPILCWTTNEWDSWANDIESANIASKRACWGSTPEGNVTAGVLGKQADVTRFNQCVERELKEAMLEAPNAKPNYLQVLLTPVTELLKALLDPVGAFLAGPVLKDVLGIELGVADVHMISIECGTAELVY